jgi:hypothetical protein
VLRPRQCCIRLELGTAHGDVVEETMEIDNHALVVYSVRFRPWGAVPISKRKFSGSGGAENPADTSNNLPEEPEDFRQDYYRDN